MPSPIPKPTDRRQRPHDRGVGIVPTDPVAVAPMPPSGVLATTKQAWCVFWRSKLASLVKPDSDLPALERLFSLYDERERCYRAAKKNRLVQGSQGQMVLNPLYKQMNVLDTEIRNLEDRFGLTPMARLKLGVQFGDTHRSLEEMNRRLDADDETEPDPRAESL